MKFENLPKLKAPPPFLVGHWTAGEGLADRVYRVLVARGLSVHFVLEPDGTLVQLADLDRRCAHAGRRGNVGIGVEIVSAGLPPKGAPKRRPFAPERAQVATQVHGRAVMALAFTDAQIASYVALADRLAAEFGWRREVPGHDRVMTAGELAAFSGALEHLHLSPRKVDSGMLLTGALVKAGWRAV